MELVQNIKQKRVKGENRMSELVKAIEFKKAIEEDGGVFCQPSTEEYTVGDVKFEITDIIPIGEMLAFVESVVQSCFDENGNYLPEIKDFAVLCEVFNRYTNIELPEDIGERYMFVYQMMDCVSDILDIVSTSQFNHLMDGIDRKIAYRAHENFESTKKKVDELTEAFDAIGQELEKLFAGIDQGTMNSLVNAMIDGFNGNDFIAKYVESTKQGDE